MSVRTRILAALVCLTLPAWPLVATAQAQSTGDPPAEVARIAEISGAVSFHAAGSQDWQAAAPNYPVTAGSGVWTEPRAHAAVDVAGARVHLDGASDLEITGIDPQGVTLSVQQGAVFLHVYPGAVGQTFEVDTPHGAARIAQPGQYEIEAGDDQHPMTLSVYEGAAQMLGQSANFVLQAGQRGSIAPDNSASSSAVAPPDDFVRMVQAAEQPYANAVAQTAQYVSPQETGYQDLARYGQWQTVPEYGAVWYPRQVAAGWAPYRYGHWAYVAPWGWTWVDDAPWGFTPFHYGRWVEVHGRWAWVPGVRAAQPVYAPALVTFFGDLGGVGISLSVGWVPLAPEEVYVPPYRHSARYVRDINITNVRNETTIVNVVNNRTVVNYSSYRNRQAATAVNRSVMAGARPVAPAFRQEPRAQLEQHWSKAKPATSLVVQPQYQAPKAAGPKVRPHNAKPQSTAPKLQAPKAWNANGANAAKPSGQKAAPSNAQVQAGQKPRATAPAPNLSQQKPAASPKSQGQRQPQQGPKNAAPAPIVPPLDASTAPSTPAWQKNRSAQPGTPPVVLPNQKPASRQNSNVQPSQNTKSKTASQPARQDQKRTAQPKNAPSLPYPAATQNAAPRQDNRANNQAKPQLNGQSDHQAQSGKQNAQQQFQNRSQQNGQRNSQNRSKHGGAPAGNPPPQNCNPQQGGACAQ